MTSDGSDRIAGVLVGLATGDALGAGYEFGPAVTGPVGMIGGGPFNWESGEWTDDTQMAICVAEESSPGTIDISAVGDRFIAWASKANDVGNQTRAVLSQADSGADLTKISLGYHARHPQNSAGNGSLMRTAVVALAFLGDPVAAAAGAIAVSGLTHADPRCADACVLWTVAVSAAVASGEIPDLRDGLERLPRTRRDAWSELIAAAEEQPPGAFTPNGYVTTAFQAAWSSITHTAAGSDHFRSGVTQAVRIGDDTDTVAAIAGALLGGVYGASAIPDDWIEVLHGWPGYDTPDLTRIAHRAAGTPRRVLT